MSQDSGGDEGGSTVHPDHLSLSTHDLGGNVHVPSGPAAEVQDGDALDFVGDLWMTLGWMFLMVSRMWGMGVPTVQQALVLRLEDSWRVLK